MSDLHTKDLPSSPLPAGFEALLWDLFLELMDVPADCVEARIFDALRRICRALGLDRSSLWQTPPDGPVSLRVTHFYDVEHDSEPSSPGDGSVASERGHEFRGTGGAIARYADASEHFPWIAKRLLKGEATIVDSPEGLPAEAATDAAELRRIGTFTTVVIPLEAYGSILGCLTFAAVRRREWSPLLVSRFARVAGVFAKALARKRADERLRESDARLELAATSAEAGLWDLDLTTGRLKATEVARRLLGFSAGEDLDMEKVLGVVHPDDQHIVRERIEWARRHREGYSEEWRALLPDGSIRHLHVRGRSYATPGAPSDRVLGVIIDITERRRADELAQESRARLEMAVDVAGLGYFELRGAGREVFADERMRSLFGFSGEPPERLWQFWIDHVHEDDRPRVAELSRRMREEGLDGLVTEYRYVHPQRGTMWIGHASRVLKRDPDGRAAQLIGVVRDITESKNAEDALRQSLEEVAQLKDRLEAENVLLHREVLHVQGFDSIVGRSAALGRVLRQVEQVAPTDSPVLLLGETGTGKDLIARALHDRSRRRERPLVTVNCAALPPTLIESELFGYERGAFTGALQRTIGRFEIADRGTIFLDEVGELPLDLQAKLLRVLQSGEFERLGSPRALKANVRLIAATNRDLEREMREGRFRADLYYRLSVFPVSLPPLRDRPEDIPLLVWHFVGQKQVKLGKQIKRVPDRLMRAFTTYAWPGNVRELENVIERALILTDGQTLAADPSLFAGGREDLHAPGAGTLQDVERAYIQSVLAECDWKVAGPGNAAERLGLNRSTLQFRMKKLGIERPSR